MSCLSSFSERMSNALCRYDIVLLLHGTEKKRIVTKSICNKLQK